MQYQVIKGEKGKVDIKVDIPKAAFDEAYKRVLLVFAKDAKISGFRPGKVPSDIVENHVGHAKLLNEVARFLVSKYLEEIFKKEKLFPLDSPKIAIGSLAKGSPFSFTATFTQKPQVKIGDWRKIKIKRAKVRKISDADINESIKNIYEAWVKNKSKVKSQKSKVEGGEESEASGQKQGTKFIYDAYGNKIFLEDNIEESSFAKVSKGKIDDDFARAIGARDLAHLREIVRRDLETLASDQVEANLEQQIFDELLKLTEVEVPEVLVEDELNRMVIRVSSQLETQGKKMDDWLSEQKTTLAELKKKWRGQAEKNVKVTLILDQIGKDEKVEVKEEEIDEATKNIKQQDFSEEQRQSFKNYVAVNIFQAKTLDFVKKTISV